MEFCRQEYWSGCHSILWGIFLPQGLNPGLLHCGQSLYLLSHPGSPYIYSRVLLYSGSQGFSTFGLLLLLFRIFSVFCLIEGLPLVPGRWYKWMKRTWWQFLGIPGDCEFMSNSKKDLSSAMLRCPLKLYPSLISPTVHFCSLPFPFLLEVLIPNTLLDKYPLVIFIPRSAS